MSYYYHLRPATSAARINALRKPDVVPVTDFLDAASEDAPEGVWSLRLDDSKGLVQVRWDYGTAWADFWGWKKGCCCVRGA